MIKIHGIILYGAVQHKIWLANAVHRIAKISQADMMADMKILGAIIAGGQSRRFGSDKAMAVYEGRRLIDIVAEGVRSQVDASVVCGRVLPEFETLDDRPAPDLGPLGGLCTALHHANLHGYDAVLSVAADVIPLPGQLVDWLAAASEDNTRPTIVRGQHLLGLWPATLASQLDWHLAADNNRSLRGWIIASNAVAVDIPVDFYNINTPQDFATLQSQSRYPRD
jgi:molybdopterin-guanine dinucleotide biosynthesis protein A